MNSRVLLHVPVLAFLALSFGVLLFSFEFTALDRGFLEKIWPWARMISGASTLALLVAGFLAFPVLSSRQGISRRGKYALAGMSGMPSILVALLGVLILRSLSVEITPDWTLVLMTVLLTPRALQLLELSIPRTLRRYREATLALGGSPHQFAWVWLWGGRKREWIRRFLKLVIIGIAEASALWVFLGFAQEWDARPFLSLLNEEFMHAAPWIIVICLIFHVIHSLLEEK
jgi:hypothetical protein